MIITKTPLRMSYVGGGSDLSSYYRKFGGAVISTTVNQYVYVLVKPRFEKGIRLSYSRTENVIRPEEIEHPLVRNALSMFEISENIEIVSTADIPSSGTGLGSSSAFSVGLIRALSAFKGEELSDKICAELACKLEIDLCKSPIGKQDQYASSFGGLKLYKFNQDDSVSLQSIDCNKNTIEKLNDQTLVFFIGGNRNANEILRLQSLELQQEKKAKEMVKMVNLVWDLKNELESQSVENFGSILHENWIIKRNLSKGVSSSFIDDMYEQGLACGASGGKLLGAGGGGFMIFHAATDLIRTKIRTQFAKLREVSFKVEKSGSSVIFSQ